jgi:hypothetical protein
MPLVQGSHGTLQGSQERLVRRQRWLVCVSEVGQQCERQMGSGVGQVVHLQIPGQFVHVGGIVEKSGNRDQGPPRRRDPLPEVQLGQGLRFHQVGGEPVRHRHGNGYGGHDREQLQDDCPSLSSRCGQGPRDDGPGEQRPPPHGREVHRPPGALGQDPQALPDGPGNPQGSFQEVSAFEQDVAHMQPDALRRVHGRSGHVPFTDTEAAGRLLHGPPVAVPGLGVHLSVVMGRVTLPKDLLHPANMLEEPRPVLGGEGPQTRDGGGHPPVGRVPPRG